jgi:predicted transglutaminase-like cysteine proteinase
MLKKLILFLAFILISNPSFSDNEGLFGSHETKYETFNLFPKWVGVLSRHKKDLTDAKLPCESSMQTSCLFLQWNAFLNTLKGQSPIQQIDAVNRYVNRHKYITDLINWGIADYWETPREFILKDGDCEDFAITKFKSLLYLGIPNDDMRIVVLQDLNLQVAHAVLAVYINDKPYILDNQVEQVVPASKIKHYMPIYSINETNWWRHG